MADPISAAAAAVAQWVASAVFAAIPSGVGIQTAATIANIAYITAYAATAFALNAAVVAGLNAIVQSSLPDPENQKVTRKQSRPLRAYLLGGASRFSGAYMLREATGTRLGVVLALAEGRLHDISQVYLNDDLVTLGGSGATSRSGWVQEGEAGAYGTGDLVRIETRLGEPTETHYSFLTPDFASVWPTTARGDGVASLMMWCDHRSRESQGKLYPNGEPIPSVVGRAACYDWRQDSTVDGGAGAQRRADPATWGPSANPVVWAVFIEWHRLGRSWDRCIAPVLAELTEEADYCDEPVATTTGSEPRYACAGNYFSNTEPDAIRAALMATMDGWLSTDGKGRLVIKAGRYVEPDFTLTAEHIETYNWRAFQRDEEACNELIVSYVSADHDYTLVEAEAWRDEAAITAMGRLRSESLQLNWVGSPSQARRLAKRKMSRLNAPRRGQVRSGIYGLNGLGKRYIRVQNAELPSMADAVLEVMNVEIDFGRSQVVFDVILADVDIDDWDPETEEGESPGDIVVPDPGSPFVDPPTDLAFEILGGTVTHTWRNGQTNFYRTLWFRNTVDDFATATEVGSFGGAPLADMDWADTPGSGGFYYWAQTRAVDTAERSDPVASGLVTIP